jgi:hypothetical protein
VTDDRFDDYVDEESISDFEAQDVATDGDLDTNAQTHSETGTDPESGIDESGTDESGTDQFGADTDVDLAIEEPGAWALPDTTGVASVDAAIAELARLDELPTSEHVAVYEGLHRQLQDALADLDGS